MTGDPGAVFSETGGGLDMRWTLVKRSEGGVSKQFAESDRKSPTGGGSEARDRPGVAWN